MYNSPLTEWRESSSPKVTLEGLGDLVGKDKSTILRWERGGVPVTEIAQVSEVTGISFAELVEHAVKAKSEAA